MKGIKDTEILERNTEPWYATTVQPDPKQHLSHPSQPVHSFDKDLSTVNQCGIYAFCDLHTYLYIRKTPKAEVVYCPNYSIMRNVECIIENISTLQQFQMNLRNFNLGKNCISFFLNSEVIFFR